MATYYARNVTGNWASNTSWDTVSSSGAGPAGPPVAGDTAIFDSGFTGSITVAAAAACTTLTCQAGAAGTLTVSAGQNLTISGNQTFVATMTLAGTGTIRANATSTIDFAGLTWPGSYTFSNSGTYTLANNLIITGTLTFASTGVTLAGAYNISAGTWTCTVGASTFTLVSGQTYSCTSAINFALAGFGAATFKASVASSPAYFNYSGIADNCKMVGIIFTDIDASGSAVPLLNWYGGTLTRTTNIYNVTSTSFPAIANVKNSVGYGGVNAASANRLTGTYSVIGPFEVGLFR